MSEHEMPTGAGRLTWKCGNCGMVVEGYSWMQGKPTIWCPNCGDEVL